MQLSSGHSLAYCTNVHRGEGWSEIFTSLTTHALSVRDQISPGKPYALGLRIGELASRELLQEKNIKSFQEWLQKENCYVVGINGFPMGVFHGQSVKEAVFLPDWGDPQRLDYTTRLFKILSSLIPTGGSGTVSTLPCSFKKFNRNLDYIKSAQTNILSCAESLRKIYETAGVNLKLALEPEPLGYFENTPQTLDFFNQLRDCEQSAGLVDNFLGVCYDTCHFALQYEEAVKSIQKLNSNGAPILKYHLSSALRLNPTAVALNRLASMQEPTYLHQCIGRGPNDELIYYKDIPDLLSDSHRVTELKEIRTHFHLPLYSDPVDKDFFNTSDFLKKVITHIARQPGLARELEIETYTWEVLPTALRSKQVTDQIISEYRWVLNELAQQGVKVSQ